MRAELQKLYLLYVVVRTSLQIAIYLIVSNRYKTLGCCRQVALAYIIIMTAHLAKKNYFSRQSQAFQRKNLHISDFMANCSHKRIQGTHFH